MMPEGFDYLRRGYRRSASTMTRRGTSPPGTDSTVAQQHQKMKLSSFDD